MQIVATQGGGLFKTIGAKKTVGTKKTTTKKTGTGPRRPSTGETLWLPNTTRPEWLDGSLPGDRGFDPLGLAKPTEFLQIDIDQLDQNAAVNKPGSVVGKFSATDEVVGDALQPYADVFSLPRFRECEVIHGRWAMLGALGVLATEFSTGVQWQDAIALEYGQPQYSNFNLPFDINQLAIANSLLMLGVEVFRNAASTDPETRIYPGGAFDPLNLTAESPERTFRLKEAEIKHGRLAMVACLGFLIQALTQGKGALASIEAFSGTF